MKILELTETSLKRITDAKENFLQNILKPFPLWLNADQLTIIRILCIFPVLFFLLIKKEPAIALGIFIFGAFLDLIDGPIARLRKKETEIGKILDAVADKVLALTTLFAVVAVQGLSFLSPLLFYLIIALDLTLAILAVIGKAMLSQSGIKRRLGANLWGKWKFFLQTIGVSLLLLQQPFWAQVVLWPSVALAIASIIGHLVFKTPEPK